MAELSPPTDELLLLDGLQRAAFAYFVQAANPANGLVADTRGRVRREHRGRGRVGCLSLPSANERDIRVKTFTVPMHEVTRAITDGEEVGFVKIHVKEGTDRIRGATILARQAGEMINGITPAMIAGIGLRTLSRVIHADPTPG